MSDSDSLALATLVYVFAFTPETADTLCSRLEEAGIRSLSIPTIDVTHPGQMVILTVDETGSRERLESLARNARDRRLILVVPSALETTACALWEQGCIMDYVTSDRLTRLPAIIRKFTSTLNEPSASVESQWESLNHVLTSIREAAGLESIFRVATDDIGKLFETDHAVVVRYYPERGIWMHEAENFAATELPTIGFQIPDANNPLAEKLKRKQIVTIEDSTLLTDPVNKQVSDRFPGSWLLIPIVVEGEIWGSLSLLKRGGGVAWITRQMTFARILAEHLGMAIHQAQLIERLRQDIEERHQLYLALRESENRFSQVIGSSPIPFFLKDPDRRYLYVNPAFEKLTGLKLSDVVGANPAELPTAGLIRICATEGTSNIQPVTFEARLELETVAHDLMVTQFPLLNENGETAALCGFLVEVTEQKNLIQTLREREQELRLLESAVEYARDSIIITDTALGENPGQHIVYVNRALQEQTGYSNEEILGKTPRIFQGPETSPETRRRIREALRDWESINVEILNYRKDGTNYWADLSIVPIQREDGIYTHWVAIQRDVTERRQFEQETRNLKKMEAIGQLTSGVAHNFNNILMIISGLAQLIHRKLEKPTKEYHQIQLIRNAALRGAELVKELMALSRSESTQSALVNLVQILQETFSMLEKVLPANIELNLDLPHHPVFVELNQERMVQSILNLVVNARDAMPDGGHLDLKLEIGLAETLLDIEGEYPSFPEGANICLLEVRDTGIGMDTATQERIFEPFFTTKEVGHGTGLGLFSVFGFVYESKGIIRVVSTPGKGTTFRLAFPLSRKVSVPETPEAGNTEIEPISAQTVLLVEDEPDTRDLLEEMLEDGGLKVVMAANGEEALRVAQETPGGFDLMITDWVMPKMSGRALISVMTQTYPSLPIIIMTGNFDLSLPPGFDPARFLFLTKPFSQKDLLDTVNRALAGSSPQGTDFKSLIPE